MAQQPNGPSFWFRRLAVRLLSPAHRDVNRLAATVEAKLDPASRERIDDWKIRDTAPVLVALATLRYKTLHDHRA